MIFRRISHRIAGQFTAFVFLLLLVNGITFLAVDLQNDRFQRRNRLTRSAEVVFQGLRERPRGAARLMLPPQLRERVRIVDANGTSLYTGSLFEDIPFDAEEGIDVETIHDEPYGVLTTPFQIRDLEGFVQVAERESHGAQGLPFRIFLLLIVSIAVSVLTFFIGLFFARSSLKPAEEMMERLEQFTQDASHELRTPLASLNSSLDLALKTGNHREGIESAKEDVQEISVLVERLLELARLDTFILKKETIDASALLAETAEKFRDDAGKKHVTLHVTAEPAVKIDADPTLFKQLISNLLSNAIKFSKKEGGAITATLTKDSLTIKDTGIGIPKSALPHIFDRFYRADSARTQREGFGLGLSLVQEIAEQHGWKVEVESMENYGSIFVIRF